MTGNKSARAPLTMTRFTIVAGPFTARMHLPLWPGFAPLPRRPLQDDQDESLDGRLRGSFALALYRHRCGPERSRISGKALSAMTVAGAT
jgi:hypothetical protein